ncbi:MaoC/PaaZ C-terminal domain-containing protein [Winogradskya consettensis]|uniref:MaoC family dehydratase n=2 Tax=Winogradskya consettensis TaxID=113560 RepID=A0A919T552_9ACTN|nr:MaoC family dehydratase [Actinoplanes consettensis]
MTTMWFEDFQPGQIFRTQGRTITEADVTAFANLTWDTNPVHTDAEFGAAGRFGQRIAHGMLGASFVLGLASRLGVFEGSSIALLGVTDWRFLAPVLIGDTLTCQVEIRATRLTSKGTSGILDRWFTLTDQHGTVVQEGRIDLMVALRP